MNLNQSIIPNLNNLKVETEHAINHLKDTDEE